MGGFSESPAFSPASPSRPVATDSLPALQKPTERNRDFDTAQSFDLFFASAPMSESPRYFAESEFRLAAFKQTLRKSNPLTLPPLDLPCDTKGKDSVTFDNVPVQSIVSPSQGCKNAWLRMRAASGEGGGKWSK